MAKRDAGVGSQLPLLTPESSWRRPTTLPDLRGRPEVVIDTETRDDSLSNDRGPGWAYGLGYISGVSWAVAEADGSISSGYAPIRDPDSENFDKAQVSQWLRDLVASGTRLVFQNGPYDVGWIYADLGVQLPLGHKIDDALCMNFMIDENQLTYNLDDICARLGIQGKDERMLMEAGEAYLRPPGAGRAWKLSRRDLKRHIWKLPARYKGAYAEQDAVSTLRAAQQMRPTIEAQDLGRAYELEMNLVPVVQRMRARGIKVDTALASKKRDEFLQRRDGLLAEVAHRLPPAFVRGGGVTMENLRTNKWMEPVFKDQGISFPKTEKTGQGSFSKDWMEKHEHWLPKVCVQIEKYDMAANKFLKGFVMDFAHRGRLHAEFHQYKSDDGGTVSYRFAISDPPLQQMPSPDIDAEIGNAVRECFVADPGAVWGCYDASQQEYRLTAHYAAACKVLGGEAAVEAYRRDPKLDYHKFVAELTGLTRAKAKIQNFALLYGQGLRATAEGLGISIQEAEELRKTVEQKAPFGPALADFVKGQAQKRGYIRLIDGARCRFDDWECSYLENDERRRGYAEKWSMAPCPHEEAVKRTRTPGHPWEGKRLKRAYVNKAMNRLIQGSAARQIKRGMWDCAQAGLIPVLQVHDELNFVEESPEVLAPVKDIMLSGFPLLVPMMADGGCGPNWAAAKAK